MKLHAHDNGWSIFLWLIVTSCNIFVYFFMAQLNGLTTQGENIADNKDIEIAYLAYKNWVTRKKLEKKLCGIDRTSERMFWLSAANFWCSKYNREALKLEVMSKEHSPEEFRIIGLFSNMPEFANDFKCPEGSRMNFKNKCWIW